MAMKVPCLQGCKGEDAALTAVRPHILPPQRHGFATPDCRPPFPLLRDGHLHARFGVKIRRISTAMHIEKQIGAPQGAANVRFWQSTLRPKGLLAHSDERDRLHRRT
jgi:hypothetical protein